MKTGEVTVMLDIYCKWSDEPPRYRVFVNDELFTERTWIWQGVYLEETLQIIAPPGAYPIRVELVQPGDAGIKVRNIRVEGTGRINPKGLLEIWYAD